MENKSEVIKEELPKVEVKPEEKQKKEEKSELKEEKPYTPPPPSQSKIEEEPVQKK